MAKITLLESAAPATPSAGHVEMYAKTDGKVYTKDDTGAETDLTAAGTQNITDLSLNPATELTLSSGAVTQTQSYHTIAAQSDNYDYLDTITPSEGEAFILIQAKSTDTIIVTPDGNIDLTRGATRTLEALDMLLLFWDATTSKWRDVGQPNSFPLIDEGSPSAITVASGVLDLTGVQPGAVTINPEGGGPGNDVVTSITNWASGVYFFIATTDNSITFDMSALGDGHPIQGTGGQITIQDNIYMMFIKTALGGFVMETTEFADGTFKLFDSGDDTAQGSFDLSGVTGGQNRVVTWPDANVSLSALAFVTFDGDDIVINDGGLDLGFRVESQSDENQFVVNPSTGRVHIGAATQAAKFSVEGAITDGHGVSFSPVLTLSTGGFAIVNSQAIVVPSANLATPVYGLLFLPTLGTSSDDVAVVYGSYKRIDSAAGFSGGWTNAYLDYLATPVLSGSAPDNLYALWIEDMTGASGNNYAAVTNSGHVWFNLGNSPNADFRVDGDSGALIETDSSGDAMGFWGATPVAQHSSTGQTAGFAAGTGTPVNDDSTFTGGVGATTYTIGDVVKALKNSGIMAA